MVVRSRPVLSGDVPVTGCSTELSVVFDLWLRAAGPHCGHTSVREGKGDHLTGTGSGKNLETRTEQGNKDN